MPQSLTFTMANPRAQRRIQSIEVGGRLLAALVAHGRPMPLRELAHEAGMTSAKAHPYLVSFSNLNLIEQDQATGHYALGPFALQMGLVSLRLLEPVRVAIPEAAALATDIAHTVALAVAGTHGATIVHISESSYPVHVNMHTGTVMSTLNTATGRVFAAWLPPAIVEHLIARERRDGAVIAQGTAALAREDVQALRAEVRRRGMARAVGHPIPGINAVSVPVFDHTGAIVLALTTLGPSGSFDAAWNGVIARKVRACAARVSARLGYR
jgi:DNA-binding IclR family transcriptional regulator